MHPSPIRTDGSNRWAIHTIRDRLPVIIEQIIEAGLAAAGTPSAGDINGLASADISRLRSLADELRADAPLAMFTYPADDTTHWRGWFDAHAARMAPVRPSWQNCEWFFSEHFFYRLILEAVRFAETGRDPFGVAKAAELHSPSLLERLTDVLEAAAGTESLTERVLFALWGNQLDLSHAESLHHSGTRDTSDATSAEAREDHLIANDLNAALELIHTLDRPVHVICDNAGTELVADLCLADWFITGRDLPVTLHVKRHPTFVSDATPADVRNVLTWMTGDATAAATHAPASPTRVRELGNRLQSAISQNRLRVAADPFWTSPLFMTDLPETLRAEFAGAGLIIIKGDMNYRRQVRDTVVPASEPLNKWAAPMPAPALFLRTMKGDPVAGIAPETLAALDHEHPGWRTAGKHGLIQLLA